jgi:hypothetical protein
MVKIITVKKSERDAGPKHLGDGKFRHSQRRIGKIHQQYRSGRSTYMANGMFRHLHVLVLRHA